MTTTCSENHVRLPIDDLLWVAAWNRVDLSPEPRDRPLAVIEVKKQSINPYNAKQQALL